DLSPVLTALADNNLLRPGALVIAEQSSKATPLGALCGLEAYRTKGYKTTRLTFLRYTGGSA
ncbi:MAG: hypothetical protein FWD98_05215, partial [Defluviitaleaceae bacterium]|nr:hypothetical protein [Defluviitaleaceae bacterium]